MKIKENFFRIKEEVEKAAKKAGRSPEEISIVAAGKGRSATEIQEAVEAGIKIVGENRVQEAK
ncbi:MAG TPA: YggS family pyridoxal phosphate enzyme, partial [bacterium]|nr:YggS family pyridoxal phosphate enzyme [bacterium]HEX67683.1 YggS family pyridoxal phosphate enzyme [bacterium]